MYFEVLADYELPMYGYHSRTKGAAIPWQGLKSTPQTCPIITRPNGHKKTIKLTTPWMNFIKAINTPIAYKYIIQKAAGWFNQPYPHAETLAMGSGRDANQKNFVKGEFVNRNYIKISTFRLQDTPPNPDTALELYPYLFQRFNIIGIKDQVYDGKPGGVWIFLISDVDMYMPTSRVRPIG